MLSGPGVEEINRHSFVVERHGKRYEVWYTNRILTEDAETYADCVWDQGGEPDGVDGWWGAREMKEDA